MKLDQDPQASPRESGNLEYEDLCERAGSQRECQWQLTHSGGTAVKVTATLLARASEPRTAQSGPINHETRFASSQRNRNPPARVTYGVNVVDPGAGIIGRERELAVVDGFVAAADCLGTCLVLEGLAGIGKTTIWAEGVSVATRRGIVVRSSRCTAADATWAFSGLGDLLEETPEEILAELPEVQRRALSTALLVESPTVGSPGDRVVGVAVLGVLRLMAREEPLILAID